MNLQQDNRPLFHEKVNQLAVTYYNLGIEYEFKSNVEDALAYYAKACSTYEKYQVTQVFMKMYFRFKEAQIQCREKNLVNTQFGARPAGIHTSQYQAAVKRLGPVAERKAMDFQDAIDLLGEQPTGIAVPKGKFLLQSKSRSPLRNRAMSRRESIQQEPPATGQSFQSSQFLDEARQYRQPHLVVHRPSAGTHFTTGG